MRRLITTLLLIALLSLLGTAAVSADHGPALYGCPNDFHLHHVMDHDHAHMEPHRHVGSDVDRNGDGYLCVKHNNGGAHVHIDNHIPLP